MSRKYGFACAVMFSALFLMAGTVMSAEQKKPGEAGKGQPAATQAPANAVPQAESAKKVDSFYEYTGMGRRDPFTSLIQTKGASKGKGISALESYDTSEMKLIAILWDKTRYYAVVSLPDGKSYTVYEKVKVGTSSGVIKKITKDSMVISERVRDARGRINPKDRVLKLRSEEE
jgi:Tfp pilus assembly protein PilP